MESGQPRRMQRISDGGEPARKGMMVAKRGSGASGRDRPETGRIRVRLEGGCYRISFPYDEELIDRVKTLPQREYDPARKSWKVRATPAALAKMIGIGLIGGEDDIVGDGGEAKAPPVGQRKGMLVRREDFGECDETAPAPVQAAAPRKGMAIPKRQEIPDPAGADKGRASVTETPEGTYRVEFAYDAGRVAAIKAIDGARFEREKDGYGRTVRGWWETPMTGWHRLRLVQEGFMDASAIPDPDWSFIGKTGMFPYQVEGAERLCGMGLCGLLADDPGLGKPAQAIAAVWAMRRESLPCLVVCGKNDLKKWISDIRRFAPGATVSGLSKAMGRCLPTPRHISMLMADPTPIAGEVLASIRRGPAWPDADFVACDREAAALWGSSFGKARTVVIDEAQGLDTGRNDDWAAYARPAAGRAFFKIYISGKPIGATPMKFFGMLSNLRQKSFPSMDDFGLRFCEKNMSDYARKGYTFGAGIDPEGLMEAVGKSGCMVRRTAEEVSGQVPKWFLKESKGESRKGGLGNERIHIDAGERLP